MTIKKIALLLLMVFAFTALVSCGGNKTGSEDTTASDGSVTDAITDSGKNEDTTAGGENNNGSNGDVAGNVSSSSSLSDIMAYILDGVQIDYAITSAEVADDQFEWNFFIPKIEGSEAYTSLAMIGSIPHTISLLRVPDGTSVEDTVKSISDNINPRKWICVEAEATAVESAGNVILVAMSDTAIINGVKANFEKLK